jgi:hypothetical protein
MLGLAMRKFREGARPRAPQSVSEIADPSSTKAYTSFYWKNRLRKRTELDLQKDPGKNGADVLPVMRDHHVGLNY